MTPAKGSSGGQVVTPVAHDAASRSDAAASLGDGLAQLLTLTVQQPRVGVRVVRVEGELDMLTAPLLDACLREQLVAGPAHLILDLQLVRFLGCTGLACLLDARELAAHLPGTQLHLSGLITRAVARPLSLTAIQALFDGYPTLATALAAMARSLDAAPSEMNDPATD